MPAQNDTRSKRYAWILIALALILVLFFAVRAMGSSIDAAGTTTTTAAPTTTTSEAETPSSTVAQNPAEPTTTTAPTTTTSLASTTTEAPATTTTTPATGATTTTKAPATTTTTAPPTTTTTQATADVTVTVTDHEGSPIEGADVEVAAYPPATTDAAGTASFTLVPGDHDITVIVNGTDETKAVTIGTEPTNVPFTTGLLGATWSGDITVDGSSLTEPISVLPGTYSLEFTERGVESFSATADVVAGAVTWKTAIVGTLSDADGQPTASGAAAVDIEDSWTPMGATTSNGAVGFIYDGSLSGEHTVRMQAPGGGEALLTQDVELDSVFDFATAKASAMLIDNTGLPLAGGRLEVLSNGRWHSIGTTDATGTVTYDIFPGTYSLTMAYNGTAERRDDVDPIARTKAFQTGLMTIQFSGTASWGTGAMTVYDGPQQVLPGTYVVSLSGPKQRAVTDTLVVEAGSDTKATGVYVTVLDADGDPVEGAQAKLRASGSPSLGTTNEHGVTAALVDGLVTGRKQVQVDLNGTRSRQRQDLAVTSFFSFSTLTGTVEVLDNEGLPVSGVDVLQKAGAWTTIGTTDEHGTVSFEVFPGTKRNYRVTHAGSTATKGHRFSADSSTLTFQTMLATVAVVDGAGDPIQGLEVLARNGTWSPIGTTDAAGTVVFEIFPGVKRQHRVTINGTTATRNHTFTTTTPTVTFATTTATVRLVDSGGGPIVGVPIEQKSPKWAPIGTTDEDGSVTFEAFAQKRNYRVTVGGTTATQKHTFKPGNDTLTFQTIAATIRTVTRSGEALPGVDIEQKTSGWNVIGTTDRSGELTIELFANKGRAYRATFADVTRKKSKKFTARNSVLELVFPNSVLRTEEPPPEDLPEGPPPEDLPEGPEDETP